MDLATTIDQRAQELLQTWIELEKYKFCRRKLTRLSVLDPLIKQLEKVAEAGIGDVVK